VVDRLGWFGVWSFSFVIGGARSLVCPVGISLREICGMMGIRAVL
jgi:hypothetical protein